MRADFADLSDYDQVGRVLRELVAAGELMKLGYGLYARAARSPFSPGPVPPRGLATLREALERLGVRTGPSRLQLDYNAGRTTQVPTGRVVAIDRRVRRKLGYNGIFLSFEHAQHAAG